MTFSKELIPAHLKKYVVEQHYEKYTPIDQAVWRYVMRQNHHFLRGKAHSSYLDGFRDSGIDMESIPNIKAMNDCLEPYGWGAVTIDGYIPGVAFFDFQARGILPIATDIRQAENIEYTPAPDIIHEAAGHAPILCDPTYARYVKIFGEIGSKAIATKEEHEVFEAIKRLSGLLESGKATEVDIQQAKASLDQKQNKVKGLSESEQISRLYWWTVEYGLIGEVSNPRIYGAGLLSSVGESAHSLTDNVKKVPFDLESVIHTAFNITTMQPQLFVCQSFDQLISAVQQFSKRMAFSIGGTESLVKALHSENTTHITYSSGLQVTGTVSRILYDAHGEAVYFKTIGPTALTIEGKEIPGHGKEVHADGFGGLIGALKGQTKALENFTNEELKDIKLVKGQKSQLYYESGIIVKGVVEKVIRRNGKIILIAFKKAKVTNRDELLFDPNWGPYHMVVGEHITSVAAGAADPEHFFATQQNGEHLQRVISTPTELTPLEKLYGQIRSLREDCEIGNKDYYIGQVLERLTADYPNDWLLRIEILEMLAGKSQWRETINQLHRQLQKIEQENSNLERLITNGLRLI